MEPVFYDSAEKYWEYKMQKEDKILEELRTLNLKLYGKDGFEGDIPEIKKHVVQMNGTTRGNEVRSKVNQAIIGVLLSTSLIGAGATKLLGMW